MFDFAKIGDIAGTLETGIRDMDSRLQSVENLMLTLVMLQAMDMSERYRIETGHPADVTNLIDDARERAAIYRSTIAARRAASEGTENAT